MSKVKSGMRDSPLRMKTMILHIFFAGLPNYSADEQEERNAAKSLHKWRQREQQENGVELHSGSLG